MVTTVTSLGRSGLFDWMVQRISALVLAAYTLFVVVYLLTHPDLSYETWTNLYQQLWMRIFSLLALVSVAAHGWVGLWVVVSDYLNERMVGSKGLIFRIVTLGLYAVVTIFYLIWGVEVLWGI